MIGAFMRDAVTMWSGTTQAARSLEWLEPREPGGSGFVIESAPGHPGLIGLAFPWESTADFQAIMTRVRRIAPLIAIVRDTGPGGRVRSTGSGGVRIDYPVGPVEVATLRRGLVEMARLGRAAGAGDMVGARDAAGAGIGRAGRPTSRSGPSPRTSSASSGSTSGRIAGWSSRPTRWAPPGWAPTRLTTRSMSGGGSGRMPAAAIVPGLYVGDGSLFPTAIGVNPMITIMVLARRVARTVLAEAWPRAPPARWHWLRRLGCSARGWGGRRDGARRCGRGARSTAGLPTSIVATVRAGRRRGCGRSR